MGSHGVRNAYALLGLAFLVVFVGAYMLLSRTAEAPVVEEMTSAPEEIASSSSASTTLTE